jgi:hypothetical protein
VSLTFQSFLPVVRMRRWLPAAMVLPMLVLAGCGDSGKSTSPPSGTTTFVGALAGNDGSSGKLTVTANGPVAANLASFDVTPTAAAVTETILDLTGSVALSDGSTVTLTGTINLTTGAVSVSGGGLVFTGTYSVGRVTGTWNRTSPSVDGVFSLSVSTSSTDVAVYCGTFTGREPDDFPTGGIGTAPDDGTWNMVVGASTLDVIILSDGGEVATTNGTRTGNTLSISAGGGTATGTLRGAGGAWVDGNYTLPGSRTGTFQGSTAACTAGSESAAIASILINDPGIVLSAASQRLELDSILVFATAKDAAGNFVAAPDLQWTVTGGGRTNTEVTARGQKWLVPTDTGKVVTITAKSKNNTSVTASKSVLVPNLFP